MWSSKGITKCNSINVGGLHSKLRRHWAADSVTRPEVTRVRRWRVLGEGIALHREAWWTVTDFTYEAGALSEAQQLLSACSFCFVAASTRKPIPHWFSVPYSLIVLVTEDMIILFIWSDPVSTKQYNAYLLQGQKPHQGSFIIMCNFRNKSEVFSIYAEVGTCQLLMGTYLDWRQVPMGMCFFNHDGIAWTQLKELGWCQCLGTVFLDCILYRLDKWILNIVEQITHMLK